MLHILALRSLRARASLVALALVAGAVTSHAQQVASRTVARRRTDDAPPARAAAAVASAEATRAQREPVLDGRDDDEAWKSARVIDEFRTWDPTEDGVPRFRTESRVAYDDRNLYVLVRAFDPHPDSIVARLARRDTRSASDEVRVMVDGYRDRRTGFEFIVNPAGVKRDASIVNDGEEDLSWDAVWDAAARIDSLGWVAEFRIPLSQIRYPNVESHTFGLMIHREVPRINERYSWPSFRRSKSGLASQFGELSGIRGLASPRRLEVSPYTVARTENAPRAAGFRQTQSGTTGADVKYGITSNLTLDATVNPDFGQVEADPSVLNLGTSETFFNERRPFFLEGQGLFRFDINCNDGRCSGLFYSRRIGRGPQLGGQYGDETNPTSTNILGAAKLSGRLGNGVSIGVLDAVTSREAAPGDTTIEPQTNYFVGRVQKELRGGGTSIGLMATNVRRSLDDWSSDYLRRDALAAGLDVRHQFLNKTYEVNGYVAQSRVAGSEAAIASTQRGLVHNYGRPDGDAPALDSTRTSLAGTSAQVVVAKIGGKHTRFSTGYQYLSPGFEINDLGFLGRANQQSQFFWFQYRDNEPKKLFRQWIFNVNEWSQFSAGGLRSEVGGNLNFHAQFKSNWWIHLGQGGNALAASDCDLCARGGPAVRQSPSGWGWAGVEGDGRKRVVPYFFTQWGWGDEGRSHNVSIDPSVDFRLSSRFNASLGAGYAQGTNATQWVDNFASEGSETHHTFAALDQKTLSMTARLNFTATPTLSLQLYAQPFVTSGRYDDWMELASPRARRFEDRYRAFTPADGSLRDYDFNFKQLRSTSVLRWEYRPGSTLFFVWTQERMDAATDPGSFQAGRDYRTLFSAHPRNVFLVKGSYWLSL